MWLRDLIKTLEGLDPSRKVPLGFGCPDSYRGYYHDLAFEPVKNTTVGQMLAGARSAVGRTFQGYKGGDFTMGECTDVWLADYGRTGETIGPVLLAYMLGQDPLAAAQGGCRRAIREGSASPVG